MPFKKNDEIELTIDDLGVSGEGIGHIDGYAVFVKGAIPGRTCSRADNESKEKLCVCKACQYN